MGCLSGFLCLLGFLGGLLGGFLVLGCGAGGFLRLPLGLFRLLLGLLGYPGCLLGGSLGSLGLHHSLSGQLGAFHRFRSGGRSLGGFTCSLPGLLRCSQIVRLCGVPGGVCRILRLLSSVPSGFRLLLGLLCLHTGGLGSGLILGSRFGSFLGSLLGLFRLPLGLFRLALGGLSGLGSLGRLPGGLGGVGGFLGGLLGLLCGLPRLLGCRLVRFLSSLGCSFCRLLSGPGGVLGQLGLVHGRLRSVLGSLGGFLVIGSRARGGLGGLLGLLGGDSCFLRLLLRILCGPLGSLGGGQKVL